LPAFPAEFRVELLVEFRVVLPEVVAMMRRRPRRPRRRRSPKRHLPPHQSRSRSLVVCCREVLFVAFNHSTRQSPRLLARLVRFRSRSRFLKKGV